MKVGVIGSGAVGETLAAGFLKHGHEVLAGSRTPEKLAGWVAKHPGLKTGTFAEAAGFGEVVVLAVAGHAAAGAIRAAGPERLSSKTVIDACNPIAQEPPVKGVLQFFTPSNHSLLEQLQAEFPAAHFVKAFNSVGAPRMVNPVFSEGKPTMFICGNDAGAKGTVGGILDQFGWETADMGAAEAARAIEPLCRLWCILGFTQNEWTHAFRLLRK